MKRKTMALLLALSMCLSLLTACGSGNTATDDKPSESENAASSTEQPEGNDKPEESGKPKEEEPEESAKPTQEEPKEEENAGTKLLALLQEEWNNGFVEGEGPRHTYFDLQEKTACIYNGVVYIHDIPQTGEKWGELSSYDITSKELRDAISSSVSSYDYPIKASLTVSNFIDGNFYYTNFAEETRMYDCNGTLLNSFQQPYKFKNLIPLEHGFLAIPFDGYSGNLVLLSYDLEKIADIPAPQREIEHGLKEDVKLRGFFVADRTAWANGGKGDWFRLNTNTYEWENAETPFNKSSTEYFCGKYRVADGYSIIDWVTGEEVFNCIEAGVYSPVSATQYRDHLLCYFGGDKYLGFNYDKKEYRWVNLKDLTMSDPLPFPESVANSSDHVTILNDTYCVYYDSYGWFLWNYNTGEEETIYMFEK